MTEPEWLAATDPEKMLEFLRGKSSERKARLFACACCRRIWHLLQDQRSRVAVEFTERSVDAASLMEVRDTLISEASDAYADASRSFNDACNAGAEARVEEHFAILTCAAGAAWVAVGPTMFEEPLVVAQKTAKRVTTCLETDKKVRDDGGGHFVRDIFGNPFRPVAADPSWLTPTVLALARQMYESRDFYPMPVLADALQDAGCDNAVILDHCRGPEPHVRGCYALDLILGKS